MSGGESLASFTNRTFHLSRPPGFRRAFDAAERNGRFGRIQCQKGKESSSRGKSRVFFCRWTVKVKVGGKAIPASFLKIEGRGTLVGAIGRREGRIEKLVSGQNPRTEAPPRRKKGQEKRGTGHVRRGATARGAMEKGRCVRVIEREEVRGDDPVEYFLPTGVGSTFWVPEGVMAIEVLQNEEISGGGREGVGSAIRWGGAIMGRRTH